MPRGGKRKGAGRKVGSGKYGEPTKPVRVPVSLIDKVKVFINKWRDYENKNEEILKKTHRPF